MTRMSNKARRLYKELKEVSGHQIGVPGPVYGTIDLPGFNITRAQRDTKIRLDRFGIGSLQGKSVLDIGCNTGAIAFECYNRGASQVWGIEIDKRRVEVANKIAKFTGIDDKVRFADFDISRQPLQDLVSLTGKETFDAVLCLAVDLWVDPNTVDHFMGTLTADTLYFECNHDDRSIEWCTKRLSEQQFDNIIYVGDSTDDDRIKRAPDRLNFVAKKK